MSVNTSSDALVAEANCAPENYSAKLILGALSYLVFGFIRMLLYKGCLKSEKSAKIIRLAMEMLHSLGLLKPLAP